jgi:AcrR family transcriptional regulator
VKQANPASAIRIVKHPDQRRAELLDCAQQLFLAHGYDDTTVNDVIDKAGVSKGAFYHYFTSKEALLEALAERFARQSIALLGDILEAPSLDALSRMNAFLERSRQLRRASAPMVRPMFGAIYRPENIVLFHRINTAVAGLMTPVLAQIIAQGVKEGIFHTPDPMGTAGMILQLGVGAYGVIARALDATTEQEIEEAADTLESLLELHGVAIERILGVPEGSLQVVEPGFARAILMAPPTSRGRSASLRSKRKKKT